MKLLEEGLTLFREGRYQEAGRAFEKAFALDPTKDQVARFMEAANVIYIMQMLRSDDPKISGIANTLLELRKKRVRAKVQDPERVKAAVEKVFSVKEEEERLIAMLKGANEYGRNLVPFLVPKLGDPEPSVRTLALLWITKIEVDAIPPLVAAARHPEAMVRENVARLLGARPLRLPFSLGTLAGMAETDPSSEVKEAARESFDAILRDRNITQTISAKGYHTNAAMILFLNPHRNPFAGPEYPPTIYTLKDKEVVGEVVAPFQLSARLAEQELVEALRLDPDYAKAKVYLAMNEALQIVEYDSAVAFYASPQSSGGADDSEAKKILESQKETFDWIRRNRLRASSAELLFAGLQEALAERRPEVAEKLIEVIQENQIRGRVPKSLVDALMEGSSRLVRISAAIALAHWNPEDTGDFGEAVVGILSEAVVSSGIRTIHKVLGNSLNSNRFDAVFRELNIESGSNISNFALARERAINLPPDLILIDEEVPPLAGSPDQVPVNAFVNELRKAYRTQTTPVVVAVDPAKLEEGKKTYESDERKVLVIPADADKTTFKNLVLDKLFAGTDDAKNRATELAARAGEALAYLASTNTRFPAPSSLEALLKVLQNRPDNVRIPALVALGNLREAAEPGLRQIAEVFSVKENDLKVREAAMLALSRILGAGKGPAPQEVLKTVVAGLSDADPKLRQASFMSFAAAGATSADRLRLLYEEAKAPAAAPPEGEKPAAKKTPQEGEEGGEKKEAEEGQAEPKEEAKEGGAEEK